MKRIAKLFIICSLLTEEEKAKKDPKYKLKAISAETTYKPEVMQE